MINEHAQATAEALPKKHNSQERSRPLKVSLTQASLFKKSFAGHIQHDLFLWGLTPFYQTQDRVSFRESSSISISLTVNCHNQFLGIKIELTPSSGYVLALLDEIHISSLKTSGWRHCKSFILLDSHWTCHKLCRGKTNAVHSICMSAYKTSIN